MNSSVESHPTPTGGARILVVDDEVDVGESIASYLCDHGYRATAVTDGEKALVVLDKHQFDLILLDVMLPGKDGFTLAREIRIASAENTFLPIIMVSALRDETDKLSGLELADDYMTKPFSFPELLARVKAMLRTRALQRELWISKTRYQRLYENVPQVCLSLDAERLVSDCNAEFCEVCSSTRQDVVGRPVSDFFAPEEHGVLTRLLDSLVLGTRKAERPVLRMAFEGDDGEPLLVTVHASYIGGSDPSLAFILTMADETRRVRLEREQRDARRQLYRSARLASIGTLASGVAHEMNNPLAAVLGFSDALLDRLRNHERVPDEELLQYLEVINSETLRCRDIVESLSKFARDQEPRITQVSLLESIQSAIQLISARARTKGISIVNEVPGDLVVRADAQKVQQVVVNVLSNSIDFCGAGCTVIVSVRDVGVGPDFAEVVIADDGPGIRQQVLPKVFDPFFTTKAVGEGAGLGLSICHKLMEDCEGTIDINSTEGQGTQVVLEIPKA